MIQELGLAPKVTVSFPDMHEGTCWSPLLELLLAMMAGSASGLLLLKGMALNLETNSMMLNLGV